MTWWQIRKRDADVERELQSDLELEEEEQGEHGVSPEEAHYAALRAFGNPTLISEQTRAVWSWTALENLLRDLRISARTLFRSPGFSVLAILVMALCIGATTSLFTVVRSVLLRPLPFREPDRLVMVYEHFRDPSMRTGSDPLAVSVPVQKLVAELDPELPVHDVFTMQQIVAGSLVNASLSASLVLGFAILALILASVGLYGVLSYLTTQRTGEIGLRMALGARREQVVRLMLGDGLRPALYGLVLGLTASIGAVRLIQSMLYATRPLDPAVFGAVAITLVAVTALSCLVPAWRASRIDPMQALRTE